MTSAAEPARRERSERWRMMLDPIGTSEDVAALALSSPRTSTDWVTGANFVVDGGFTAR